MPKTLREIRNDVKKALIRSYCDMLNRNPGGTWKGEDWRLANQIEHAYETVTRGASVGKAAARCGTRW